MDVRDRATYTSSLENLSIEAGSKALPARTSSIPTGSSMRPERDSTDLSPAAHVVAQAMQMPDVRLDRVASLQQQIARGDYQVAPQDVADAMLRNLAG